MKQNDLFWLWNEAVREYEDNRQAGTAHIYRCACLSFSVYSKGAGELPFERVTPRLLRGYEQFLRDRDKSWNTVATYMKSLRAVYNRAVREGLAPHAPLLFQGVCTSHKDARRRALPPGAMGRLLDPPERQDGARPAERPALRKARLLFSLMFLLRGMPFVDAVHLRKADLQGDELAYRRRKTGRNITVWLTTEAKRVIAALQRMEAPRNGYLLPFLTLPGNGKDAYREYQNALRNFNRNLKRLSSGHKELEGLSSHAARHTWATTAYHLQMQTGLISEALGHSSISVTEHYLKSFRREVLHAANRQVIACVLDAAAGGASRPRGRRRKAAAGPLPMAAASWRPCSR